MKKIKLENFKSIGFGAAGGLASNQLSNFLEKQDFANGFEALVPVVPFVLGLGISMALPKYKAIGEGMAVVSLVEITEGLINSMMAATSTPVAGIPYFKNDPVVKLS